MDAGKVKEKIIRMTIAAFGEAPDAELMKDLEKVHKECEGNKLAAVAGRLRRAKRWAELYPSSMTVAELADAWHERVLPGVDHEGIVFIKSMAGRRLGGGESDESVGHFLLWLESGLDAPSEWNECLVESDWLPEEFAGVAKTFRVETEAALADQDIFPGSVSGEDLVQLAVILLGAAPGARLMEELSLQKDIWSAAQRLLKEIEGGKGDRAERMIERTIPWVEAMRAGFIGRLADGDLDDIVIEIALAMQDFMNGPNLTGKLADAARIHRERSRKAYEYAVTQKRDGDLEERRAVLA